MSFVAKARPGILAWLISMAMALALLDFKIPPVMSIRNLLGLAKPPCLFISDLNPLILKGISAIVPYFA
jgi:hypothetical protein